jgi:ABC-type dipeptide/oligopeptide/nickel transport system ATPase subunit
MAQFSLDDLQSPKKNRPLIITLAGEGGIGKTSLGSVFPKPVFIRTEDGTMSIRDREDVALFPVAKTVQDVFDQIETLFNSDHPFKTLVLDSITQLNVMCEQEIVAQDGKAKTINQAAGGYGAGHVAVAAIHRDIRTACGMLSEYKNMNIVFLAHGESETIDLPDQEAFMRYTIRINKKSIPHYTDNVDVVGFIKLRTYTTGDGDKKKAISDGTRIVTCYPVASHISKNRLNIKEDLIFESGTNPFAQYL